MRRSDNIAELAKALAAAQSEMQPAKMSGRNDHFKNDYATLADIIEAIRTPFGKHGLCFVQLPTEGDNRVGVVTVLMHTSGEWLESETMVPVGANSAHAHGSALTYARRRGLEAMAGQSGGPAEDDDANVAVAGSQTAANKAADTASQLKTLIEADDSVGAMQIWLELNEPQQIYLFKNTRFLSSKDKSTLREWEHRHYRREREGSGEPQQVGQNPAPVPQGE